MAPPTDAGPELARQPSGLRPRPVGPPGPDLDGADAVGGRRAARSERARPSGPAVRLVATDMDGTFLDPAGRVTTRAATAVQAARAAGIHVVPVTGRPPQALWDLAEAGSLGPYGVCSNGAAIVDLGRRAVIEVEAVPGPAALGIVDAVRAAAPGILLAADDLACFSYEPGFFEVPTDWQETLREVGDIRSAVSDGCVKLIARLPGSPAAALISVLTVAMGEHGHVTTSGLDWVDIGAPGVSKAFALARVCERLGVGLEEVVAVGDHHNDLPLLTWAGTAMAPANAIPEVRARAHRILPGNADDGVAQLLEELVTDPDAHRSRRPASG